MFTFGDNKEKLLSISSETSLVNRICLSALCYNKLLFNTRWWAKMWGAHSSQVQSHQTVPPEKAFFFLNEPIYLSYVA